MYVLHFLCCSGSEESVMTDGPVRLLASGSYRCVCVELDLYHLAVNSVLNCGAISDMEGFDGSTDVIESGAAGTDAASSSGTLCLLSH